MKCFIAPLFAFIASSCVGCVGPSLAQTSITPPAPTAAVKVPVAMSKESEISQRAFDYAALVGYRGNGKAVTRFVGQGVTGPTQHYWKPTWNVRLSDPRNPAVTVLEIEVADGSGEVVGFTNYDLRRRLRGRMAPEGLPISRGEAIRAATRLVHKIGLDAELGTVQARQVQLTLPPTAAGSLWYVGWSRQYKGIPYANQQVVVSLQAETGVVSNLRVLFTTAPPREEGMRVSETQATEMANSWVGSMGLKQLVLQPVTREIVQKNTFWEKGTPTQRSDGPGVIAWGVHYKDAAGQTYSAWVDTSSGQIVAGDSTSRRGEDFPWKKAGFQQLLVPRRVDK